MKVQFLRLFYHLFQIREQLVSQGYENYQQIDGDSEKEVVGVVMIVLAVFVTLLVGKKQPTDYCQSNFEF